MPSFEFSASFQGSLADENRLPANEGGQSIHGITKSILIPANYLFEGKVRRRRFNPEGYELNLVAHRPGSFETIYEFVFSPQFAAGAGALGIGLSANFISEFVVSMIKRSVGGTAEDRIERLEAEGSLNSGDLSAVVDAMENGVRDSHLTIERGANVVIINGNNNNVTFDARTKRYVNHTEENDQVRARAFSVASFNSNTGYGRLFDYEEGRTIPFIIPKGFDGRSIEALSFSFDRYMRKRWAGAEEESMIAIRYTTVEDADGKVKKILPIAARRSFDDL